MRATKEAEFEVLKLLAGIPVFSKLSEASLKTLAREARLKHAEKGEILFFQSDPSDAAYVVRSGNVSIVLNSFDGREMVINEMHCGDLFGELGILTGHPRSTSAIVHTKSDLLVLPAPVFLQIIESDPQFALRMLEITAGRLQLSGKRESALAFLDAQARLARLLLELEEQEQEKGYVTASQDELAHHTGLTRQTVAKVLGKWRRSGWLITGRGRILILNREALQDLERSLII